MGQVFLQFLWLGCISFGGPAAHIGYFQRTFVTRLGWLSQAEFAQLLALCQLLPGPASSQLGFAIGRHRAGLGGALAAFAGFTLPSFLLLLVAAIGMGQLGNNLWLDAALHGLKLLALVVVADAVLTMSRQFCLRNIIIRCWNNNNRYIRIFCPKLVTKFNYLISCFLSAVDHNAISTCFHICKSSG